MSERWLPVDGHSGYEVSDLGRVRSLDRVIHNKGSGGSYKVSGQIIKCRPDSDGYRIVSLSRENVYTHFKVHRLVATHFIDNVFDKPEVNHMDFDRANNCVRNLEWATKQENVDHTCTAGRHTLGNRCAVVGKPLDGSAPIQFGSIIDAQRAGYNRGAIHKCLSGVWRHHKNLVWSRA